jgi:hypothetical protein
MSEAVTVDDIPKWTNKGGHAVAREDHNWIWTLCGTMAAGHWHTVDEKPKRICRKCKELFPRLDGEKLREMNRRRHSKGAEV